MSLRFQPIQNVLLRGSYGQGFLAPSLYQLYVPQTAGLSSTGLSDPLRCPITHDNTLDCNAQFPVTFGGNPQLKPEKSEQATFGLVFEPTNQLSMSADYFKIRLTNAITNGIPVTTILGDPQYYGLITRAPTEPSGLPGRITAIQQTYINLGDTHIEGWDIEAHYKWPRMSWGRVRFDLAGTYYTRYDFQNLDGSYTRLREQRLRLGGARRDPALEALCGRLVRHGPVERHARQHLPVRRTRTGRRT